jgi:hypothetical protein
MNKTVWIIVLIFLFSCGKDIEIDEPQILKGTGTVWLSGGLMYCATQVRMENGDTLIPNQFNTEIMKLKTGNRVQLKYQELEIRESGCSIGKDCKILEVKAINE